MMNSGQTKAICWNVENRKPKTETIPAFDVSLFSVPGL